MTTKRTKHSVYNLNYHNGSAGAVSAEVIKRYIAEQKLC